MRMRIGGRRDRIKEKTHKKDNFQYRNRSFPSRGECIIFLPGVAVESQGGLVNAEG